LETDIVVKNLGEGLVGSLPSFASQLGSAWFAFFDAGWAKFKSLGPIRLSTCNFYAFMLTGNIREKQPHHFWYGNVRH